MNWLKPKKAAFLNSTTLILVGILGYYYNSTSITALIPVFLGLAIFLCYLLYDKNNKIELKTSLHDALAIVVLPIPAEPHKSKLGTSPFLRKDWNVFFISFGKIQCSMFLGRYVSTQRYSSFVLRISLQCN